MTSADSPRYSVASGRGVLVGRINSRIAVTTQPRRLLGLPIRRDLAVRRFQVLLVSGEYITCLMYGELTGGDLHKDDYVGIGGRTRKDHYVVRSVDVFSTAAGPVVRRVRPKRWPL